MAFHIVGSSPEVLARLEDGEVTVSDQLLALASAVQQPKKIRPWKMRCLPILKKLLSI